MLQALAFQMMIVVDMSKYGVSFGVKLSTMMCFALLFSGEEMDLIAGNKSDFSKIFFVQPDCSIVRTVESLQSIREQ